ncbi:hypothetical protein NC653_036628 [Populus alba x Populus x berolinensis]|uniref:Uncharacterized protein n=1 Tax=Populus alba x Populus x berolinensis TaxID=444605 RepID=A0AAD6LKN7_9ROSI|nr:hypothetical protein NC653_036628 [Populus alba x Populus x berolinensis]
MQLLQRRRNSISSIDLMHPYTLIQLDTRGGCVPHLMTYV